MYEDGYKEGSDDAYKNAFIDNPYEMIIVSDSAKTYCDTIIRLKKIK